MIAYTAIFGGFDTLIPPRCKSDAKFIYLTDKAQHTRIWIPRIIRPVPRDPRRESRRCKILSQEYFPDEDVILWHGGNVVLKTDPRIMSERYLRDADIAIVDHGHRHCIYNEIVMCKKWKKGDPSVLEAQGEYYREQGYPEDNGLYAAFLILRRRTSLIEDLERLWWGEVKRWSCRDQVSLPYVLWKLNITPAIIPGNHFGGPDYDRNPHRKVR